MFVRFVSRDWILFSTEFTVLSSGERANAGEEEEGKKNWFACFQHFIFKSSVRTLSRVRFPYVTRVILLLFLRRRLFYC